MADSIDKGIPLMTPTFFGDNDPDNPKRKTYIEREALIEDISETVVFTVRNGVKLPTAEMRGANKVIDRIKSAPTADVVEVVRCKDCKYLKDGYDGYWCQIHSKAFDEFFIYNLTHFCSYGERKEVANNG